MSAGAASLLRNSNRATTPSKSSMVALFAAGGTPRGAGLSANLSPRSHWPQGDDDGTAALGHRRRRSAGYDARVGSGHAGTAHQSLRCGGDARRPRLRMETGGRRLGPSLSRHSSFRLGAPRASHGTRSGAGYALEQDPDRLLLQRAAPSVFERPRFRPISPAESDREGALRACRASRIASQIAGVDRNADRGGMVDADLRQERV